MPARNFLIRTTAARDTAARATAARDTAALAPLVLAPLVLALLALALGGCAQWKDAKRISHAEASSSENPLDQGQQLLVEVDFVNCDVNSLDQDQTAAMWQWVDETSIDTKLRQRLLDNGLRIGVVTNAERFRDRLDESSIKEDVVEKFLNQASVASEISHGKQRIPMRLGRRYELALRQPFEGSHVTLIRADGDPIGRTLSNAQYFLSLTASETNAPQQIRLRIQPEIQYGAARQKWVSSDTAIRIDTRRETWSLDMLDIQLMAKAGDTIVIAPDHPLHGLANKMLMGNGTDQDSQQLVVLIHVANIPTPADALALRPR